MSHSKRRVCTSWLRLPYQAFGCFWSRGRGPKPPKNTSGKCFVSLLFWDFRSSWPLHIGIFQVVLLVQTIFFHLSFVGQILLCRAVSRAWLARRTLLRTCGAAPCASRTLARHWSSCGSHHITSMATITETRWDVDWSLFKISWINLNHHVSDTWIILNSVLRLQACLKQLAILRLQLPEKIIFPCNLDLINPKQTECSWRRKIRQWCLHRLCPKLGQPIVGRVSNGQVGNTPLWESSQTF